MVDFNFDIEIHVGGCFVEEPTIEYVGGSVHLLTEIDPDKLSFFEIRDLCHLVGAPKKHSRYRYLLLEGNLQVDLRDIVTDADVLNMTNLHRAWPAEKIIIYTDIDVEPLAVEYPDGIGVAHGGVDGDEGGVPVGAGGDVGGLGGDALRDEIDLDSDYDEDDDDWLNEGLEGADFGDDVFAAQNLAPQGSAPNTTQNQAMHPTQPQNQAMHSMQTLNGLS